MATRDYVGNSPRRRAGGRNIKKAAPRRFPVIPALLAGALVVGRAARLDRRHLLLALTGVMVASGLIVALALSL